MGCANLGVEVAIDKEKERLKKIERHKKSRQKSNKKYYAKIRAKKLAEKKKEGDEKGSYLILLFL